MKRIILIVCLFFSASVFAVNSGWVRDYNPATKSVTVIPSSATAFKSGQKLYIYHGEKEAGTMVVGLTNFSNVTGRLDTGAGVERKDIVVAAPEDLKKVKGVRSTTVSFKDVGAFARSWIVNVSYSSKAAGEVQTRPMVFPNKIGVKEKGKTFYSQIDADQIESLHFEWDGTVFHGKAVLLRNKKKIEAEEIISVNVQNKLKPPDSAASEKMNCIVKFIKVKDPVKDKPDTIKISVDIDDTGDALGNGRNYSLKVYSNSAFLEEYFLTESMLVGGKFKQDFFLPSCLLSPGKNRVEFFFIETEIISGDNFEKGEPKSAGEKEIEFSDVNFIHEFRVIGDGKKLKVK